MPTTEELFGKQSVSTDELFATEDGDRSMAGSIVQSRANNNNALREITPEDRAQHIVSSYYADELALDHKTAMSSFDTINMQRHGKKMSGEAALKDLQEQGLVPDASLQRWEQDWDRFVDGKPLTEMEKLNKDTTILQRKTAQYFNMLDDDEENMDTKVSDIAIMPPIIPLIPTPFPRMCRNSFSTKMGLNLK